jgi:hypothetical protein
MGYAADLHALQIVFAYTCELGQARKSAAQVFEAGLALRRAQDGLPMPS